MATKPRGRIRRDGNIVDLVRADGETGKPRRARRSGQVGCGTAPTFVRRDRQFDCHLRRRSRLRCGGERPLGRVAVDGEHHPLERPWLMLADHGDHQPRRLIEREAPDTGPERHQRK
jgi:hypothetical protein